MTRREEELYFADFFKNAEERAKQENIRIGIAENSTGRILKNAFIGLVTGKTPKREKPRAEPWLPEYDNLILSFWTPKEIKKFVSNGFTKEQLVQHTKNYLLDNAWEMDHWKDKPKKEYQEEVRRNPAYYFLEIVHFKDSKRGIPLEEWGYPDLKNQKIDREELLGIKAAHRPADALEQAVQNEFKKEKSAPVQGYTVDGMLLDSVSGKQALNVLGQNDYAVDFASLTFNDSALLPQERKLLLNQNFSIESNALSVIKASCRIKQHQNGAEPTPQMDMETYIAADIVCKADILASQLVYAEEMRQKNPKLLAEFKAEGHTDLCDKFEESFAKTNDLNSARSAVVDSYLEKEMPLKEAKRLDYIRNRKTPIGLRKESHTSKELLGKICMGFDGKPYYSGSKATNNKFDIGGPQKNDSVMNSTSYNAFLSVLKAKGR